MPETKRAKVLERIVKSGKDGCEKEVLQKEFDLTDSALFSHIHMLKKKKHPIRREGSRYFSDETPSSTVASDTPSIGSKSPDVLRYLGQHPDGVTTDALCVAFNLTKSALFSRLHLLRCKGNKIMLKDGKYILKALANKEHDNRPAPEDANLKSLLGNVNMKDLNVLGPTERNDCLDMLKKSLFYRKSAEAIIQANKIMLNITEL